MPRNAEGDNRATPDELIAMMDRTGVEKGILLPSIGPECGFMISTNEDILAAARKYPDRFIPFCNIHPTMGTNSPNTDFSRFIRYYQEEGCKGVGELCANLHFDDPLVLNLFWHCEACAMPVLFHMAPKIGGYYGLVDDLSMPRLEKCLRMFPSLTVIGHSQPFWAEISGDISEKLRENVYPNGAVSAGGAIPRLLDIYSNLYCDISAHSGYNALTRDLEFSSMFMEKHQDRLLFGTDICSPKNDHRHAELLRTMLKDGSITKSVFEKVSWQNANRVLKLGLES